MKDEYALGVGAVVAISIGAILFSVIPWLDFKPLGIIAGVVVGVLAIIKLKD